MNKKLFTLAAALMMGSAFTVNAQKVELANDTKLDGSKWYYIGTKGAEPASDRLFLKAELNEDSEVTALVADDNMVIGYNAMIAADAKVRDAYFLTSSMRHPN